MIRSKGEAGTGDVSNATTHTRAIGGEIRPDSAAIAHPGDPFSSEKHTEPTSAGSPC